MVGVHLLKQQNDLTDEEALGDLEHESRWWYALDLELEEAHLCQKTLHNFRAGLMEHDKSRVVFRTVTDELIVALGIDTSKQRMDSTHILSNIEKLSRLGVFTETIRLFLHALKKTDPKIYDTLPMGIVRRHGAKADYGDARKADRQRRLAVVARDSYRLVSVFKDHQEIQAMEEYRFLERLLKERCEIVEAAESPKDDDDDQGEGSVPVKLKEAKEVESDALQTPHDPDVTYSGHKGQGYEVQISQTCQEKDTPPEKRNPVQLMTEVKLTPSARSDARQTIPMIEALEAAGHKPQTLLADTTYSGAKNAAGAALHDVDLMAPCPKTPEEAAYWLKCQEASPAFNKNYALRSGIEGLNSEWKRTTGAGRLRVRGGQRVELAVYFKAAACNLKRALHYWLTPLSTGEPACVLA